MLAIDSIDLDPVIDIVGRGCLASLSPDSAGPADPAPHRPRAIQVPVIMVFYYFEPEMADGPVRTGPAVPKSVPILGPVPIFHSF